MQRTQISLTETERRILDAEAARTGRSIAALIRDAVNTVYRTTPTADEDVATMRSAFGSWEGRGRTGEQWVDRLRSGGRLSRDGS